jgi:MFS family permease
LRALAGPASIAWYPMSLQVRVSINAYRNRIFMLSLADMVPIKEVASWRSYVNIAATSGRSLGSPTGGFLTDTVGWRWCVLYMPLNVKLLLTVRYERSFLGQCPPTALALALVLWKLRIPSLEKSTKQSHFSKLRRIDFIGAILLSVSIVCGLLVLDLGG